jgi:hypothetical protein
MIIFLFIFITGLRNKPQGCGASVASAAGPFTTKKKGCDVNGIGRQQLQSKGLQIFNVCDYSRESWHGPDARLPGQDAVRIDEYGTTASCRILSTSLFTNHPTTEGYTV